MPKLGLRFLFWILIIAGLVQLGVGLLVLDPLTAFFSGALPVLGGAAGLRGSRVAHWSAAGGNRRQRITAAIVLSAAAVFLGLFVAGKQFDVSGKILLAIGLVYMAFVFAGVTWGWYGGSDRSDREHE